MNRPMTLIATALVAVAHPVGAQTAGPQDWGPMYGGWMWWMPFHGLIWLIILAAVVVGVVFAIRALWRAGERQGTAQSRSSALEMLDIQYAKGEIAREEYLQKKRDLAERHP